MTRLTTPSEIRATSIFSNDFETSLNTAEILLENTAERFSARNVTRGVTSSGRFVATERRADAPMRFSFNVAGPVFEIGLFFGNDDFNYRFDAVLEVFDLDDSSLGSVSVAANRNDFADQFIGLRSDTAIGWGALHYTQPGARNLRMTIDDLTIGAGVPAAVVPLPASVSFLLAGLVGLGLFRRRHKAVA